MANSIALISKYVPLLDEVYQSAVLTGILDVPNEMIRDTANAKSVLIPKIAMQGLGDYDRANGKGFADGDVTLTWETHTFSQDRGRSFQVDAMDNEETAGITFGRLAGEFIRTKVAPELDAYRFSTYVAKANKVVAANIAANGAIPAIDAATAWMDDLEVPSTERVLFVSVAIYNNMKADTSISRRFDVMAASGNMNRNIETFDSMPVVKVPVTRFKSLYVFNDGVTAGQEAGGFVADGAAKDINFMIVHKAAVVQIIKNAVPRVFDPNTNQAADAWKFDYRLYHDAWVPENKEDGIYVHTKA